MRLIDPKPPTPLVTVAKVTLPEGREPPMTRGVAAIGCGLVDVANRPARLTREAAAQFANQLAAADLRRRERRAAEQSVRRPGRLGQALASRIGGGRCRHGKPPSSRTGSSGPGVCWKIGRSCRRRRSQGRNVGLCSQARSPWRRRVFGSSRRSPSDRTLPRLSCGQWQPHPAWQLPPSQRVGQGTTRACGMGRTCRRNRETFQPAPRRV